MNYIGLKFNRLTILDVYYKNRKNKNDKRRDKFAKCLCDCGKIHHCNLHSITSNDTTSCGCQRREKAKRYQNLLGKRFGKLTVIRKTDLKKGNNRSIVWQCVCDCGNYTNVASTALNSGNTRSCGCLKKEILPLTYFKSGENHPNWDGGTTPIGLFLRRHLNEWKLNSMKLSNFKCVISGEKLNVVHHLFPFNEMLAEALENTNTNTKNELNEYTQNELDILVDEIIRLHNVYGYGVGLTSDLHKEFHIKYGYKNFSPENFQEFFYLKTGRNFDLNSVTENNQLTIQAITN